MKPRDYNPNGILMPNINFSRLLFLEAVYIKLFHIEKKHSNLARAIDLLSFDYFYVYDLTFLVFRVILYTR